MCYLTVNHVATLYPFGLFKFIGKFPHMVKFRSSAFRLQTDIQFFSRPAL